MTALEHHGKTQTDNRPKHNNKPKALKLTFNEKKALETLPQEIEQLEEQLEQLNNCLADPSCYEEKGIGVLAQELSALEERYEEKVEALLSIEEKVEQIAAQQLS